MRRFWYRLFWLAVCCTGVVRAETDPLRAAHEALFASFLPVDEFREDARLAPLFIGVRDGLWAQAKDAPPFREMLGPFTDLRGLGPVCGLPEILQKANTSVFAEMNRADRQRALFQLQSCPVNPARRLAMNVRNFYVVRSYTALQKPLTSFDLPLQATAEYIEKHKPRLPLARLKYDAARQQILADQGEIDYLVVGSGPAGSVLAHELRRGGKRVVLVERGSFIVPGSMETRLVDELIDTRTSLDGGIRIRNGLAVGGGSQVNVDLSFAPTRPSIQAKIESWRRDGRIAEKDFSAGQVASAYEWVKKAIGTRTLTEDEINANNRVLWTGAKQAGLHPTLYELNTYAPKATPYPVTDKRSAATELVLPAMQDEKNPLGLIPDADVRRVLFEGKKAVGVEVRMRAPIPNLGVIADPNGFGLRAGTTLQIRAKTVILSAGALGSAAILLRTPEVANDQVGRGIVLHASMPVMGMFDREIDVLKGTQASVFVDDPLIQEGWALESMSDQPAYAGLMSPGPARHTYDMVMSYKKLAGFGVMLIDTPSRDNRIRLDEQGEPVIEYTLSEADKARFRHGVAQAVKIMFLGGAKQVYLPTTEDLLGNQEGAAELRPLVLTDPKQADLIEQRLQFTPNRSIVTSAHMQGSNKMGASPANSVVSRNFQVWNTERLYVVDGSVFPTSIGANPMQSIYTFAKIFADRMRKSKP